MYKIIITKFEEVNRTRNEYVKVADSGNERDGGSVYDYVPNTTVEKREITILEQSIENLDMPAVIKAINNI